MLRSDEAFIPAIHALHLAQVTARYGISCAQLLAGSGLSEADLTEPEERLSLDVVERLVLRARTLTGEPAVGILLGVQMRISAHGYLGFAAMVASTIGEALDIAVRFAPTRTNALALRLSEDDDEVALVLEELADFGSARDTVILALVEGIRQIGQALTGQPLQGRAELAFAEPPYFAKVARVARTPHVRFGAPENRIVFHRATLHVPLVLADPAAFRLATAQCEKALSAIRDASLVTAKVRSLLGRRGGLLRSQGDIAKQLHVSSRTLKRHLAAEATTFKSVHDDAVRDEALRLVQTDLGLEMVADRLGYSDLANFTRAFRRWTGMTPGAYRRRGARPEG